MDKKNNKLELIKLNKSKERWASLKLIDKFEYLIKI